MLSLLFAAGLWAAQVRGIVVDQHGRPVAKAAMLANPRLNCCVTDSSGQYSYSTDEPYYVIRKGGYQSMLVRTRDQVEEYVVLRQLSGSEAVLPSCGKKARQVIGLGGSIFRFRDSVGLRISKPGADVDYSVRDYSFGSQSIQHGSGPMWSRGLPSIDFPTENYEEKVWDVKWLQVIEARGESADGKRWRFLGTLGETVEYRDVDSATARVFDKFMDSVCVTVAQ